jgi:hypothetical protein
LEIEIPQRWSINVSTEFTSYQSCIASILYGMPWLKQGIKTASGVRVVWVCILSVLSAISGFVVGYCVRHMRMAHGIIDGSTVFLGSFPTHEDAMQIVLDLSRHNIHCRVLKSTKDKVPTYQVFVYCDSKEQAVRIKKRIMQRSGYGAVVEV